MNRSVLRRPIRLLYFIPDMGGGGAERALLEYLRHHDRQCFELHLVLCNDRGVHLGDLPADVERHCLRKSNALSVPIMCTRLFGLLQRIRPDALVSFVWYANAVHLLTMACLRKHHHRPLGVCSVDAMSSVFSTEKLGSVKHRIMQWLYPTSDACFGVSQAVVDDFEHHFRRQDNPPVWVQPNPFSFAQIRRDAASAHPPWPSAGTRLLAVGRLVGEKGFDVLLDALVGLVHLSWSLIILGEGPQRGALEERIEAHNLGARVSLAGYVDNPFPFIKTADLVVCPSRTEGFGRIVVEALSLDTPVIATTCPGGPAETLEHGRLGTLVPAENPRALASALENAITVGLEIVPAAAQSLQRFDANRVVALWEAKIHTLVEGRRSA